jgi:hypothetical protein
MDIGLEEHTNLVYEGRSWKGIGVWPLPVMLQVAIYSTETEQLIPPRLNGLAPGSFIFREDTYNTASRVRRGRLYRASNSQPQYWQVVPHPAIPDERRLIDTASGTFRKSLYSFSSIRLRPYLESQKIERSVFVLGCEQGFTIWALVNIETSATGEELIILKARQNIGALPTLNRAKIIEAGGNRVLEFIEKLEIDISGAGAESVIDRAREAVTAICSIHLQSTYGVEPGKDLGALANQLREKELGIAANLASTIARLHSRGKHAEQERAEQDGRNLRPIHEQDAQLAIQAVGTILCELGWADW